MKYQIKDGLAVRHNLAADAGMFGGRTKGESDATEQVVAAERGERMLYGTFNALRRAR
jgi:hypothetical protein